MKKEICKNCKYFGVSSQSVLGVFHHTVCKRTPNEIPKEENSWCGEFKRT